MTSNLEVGSPYQTEGNPRLPGPAQVWCTVHLGVHKRGWGGGDPGTRGAERPPERLQRSSPRSLGDLAWGPARLETVCVPREE